MKMLYVACAAAVLFTACADRNPLSSTADPAGKPIVSSESVAGLPEPRIPAQFTVRIENLGTVLAPGAWVAQRGGMPFFTDGRPDRGAGLEALAEDGNPAELAATLHSNSGVFTTPVGADGPGPLTPDNAYEFTFVARPGDRLSFATMYVQSNDLFLAPGETGIALFTDGQPISGDITDQIGLWDAGTEVNEEPGVGENQAPRQAGANTGADEGGVVQLVDDGFTYPAVADIVRITITSVGGVSGEVDEGDDAGEGEDEGEGDADTDDDMDAAITATDVVDRETLEAFVLRAKEMLEALTEAEVLASLETFRTEGEWKSGSIYLSVADLHGNMIFHGVDPSLEGQNIIDIEDHNGVKIVQELLAQVANGGGFVEYLWDDPTIEGDEDRTSPKVGYAAPLSILGQELAIASGFYPNTVGMDGDSDMDGEGEGEDADTDDGEDDGDADTDDIDGDGLTISGPVAGLPEPRIPAQFTVRIENLGTVLAPGAWVAQRGGMPFFTDGRPDRGAGLEALAEDGNPAELAANLPTNSGVFTTPVGADGPGPLTPDNAYEFTFVARPGDRLSFATMYVQSNDLFLAPGETGIALFTDDQPISGDITAQIDLWDAGTEVNEEPGVGENQAPRQAGANTGADEGGVVQLVDDGFTYPAVADIVRITITSVRL